jgi:hypothetical protein
MEEAILHGCIPVIIQDEIHVPFETSLDTSQFAIRYERAKLNSLIEFLSSVSHEEVRMRSPSRPTPRERELACCGSRNSALVPHRVCTPTIASRPEANAEKTDVRDRGVVVLCGRWRV